MRRLIKTLNCATLMATSLYLYSCSNSSIEGSWVEPISGMPNKVQGVTLEKGGKAKSINMATLKYEGWKKHRDQLILTGVSIGNRQSIAFTDTLVIEQLSEQTLVLRKGKSTRTYSRQ